MSLKYWKEQKIKVNIFTETHYSGNIMGNGQLFIIQYYISTISVRQITLKGQGRLFYFTSRQNFCIFCLSEINNL